MWEKIKKRDIYGLTNTALSKANKLPGFNKFLGTDPSISIEEIKPVEIQEQQIERKSDDVIIEEYYIMMIDAIMVAENIKPDEPKSIVEKDIDPDNKIFFNTDIVMDNIDEKTNIQINKQDMETTNNHYKRYDMLEKEAQELKDVLNHTMEINDHLEKEIEELRQDKLKHNKIEAENLNLLRTVKECESLKAKLEVSENNLMKYSQDMSQKLNELVEKNSYLENLKKTSNVEIIEKNKLIKEKDDKIKNLTKELDALKAKIDKKDQAIVDLQMQMETMKKTLTEANSRIKEKGTSKENELNATIKKLKEELKAKDDEIKDSKDKVIQGNNQRNGLFNKFRSKIKRK